MRTPMADVLRDTQRGPLTICPLRCSAWADGFAALLKAVGRNCRFCLQQTAYSWSLSVLTRAAERGPNRCNAGNIHYVPQSVTTQPSPADPTGCPGHEECVSASGD